MATHPHPVPASGWPRGALGPKSRAMLADAGILSLADLRGIGSVNAFLRVRRCGGNASLNLLWALEGVLLGEHWRVVARQHRTRLLLALDTAPERYGL
jgi:DNA transformation protein